MSGENNQMYGKIHSNETLKKLSAAKKRGKQPMKGKTTRASRGVEKTLAKMSISASQRTDANVIDETVDNQIFEDLNE